MRFFWTLGVHDGPKVKTLARLLTRFYGVAGQLDKHLAPVGANLHSALIRVMERDNPRAPLQHRWIRVVDRLELFGDSDDPPCRLVSVRLSSAYGHQELDMLTS